MRYLMTFAYDGTNYCGYQKQPNCPTIQEEIERNLSMICGNKKAIIHASGRTDAHVHAYCQKAHFDMDRNISPDNIKKSLNRMLARDIFIKEIEIVPDNFHARFSVKAKEYIYKINVGKYNPFEKNYIYQYNKKLDIVLMKQALSYLEGTHNFKAFTKVNEEKEDYERTIMKTSLTCDLNNHLIISFLGNGFMRYMVRNMIGTLIEIGEGKRKSEEILIILNSGDRRKAGKTANPEGLYLKDVIY